MLSLKAVKRDQVKTVLDMTCGTVSQVFYLAEHGYEVVGSDFSPALIQIARDKAVKIGKQITFITGDMREISVGKFDAVITIFNAIGHLTKADFEKALQNIHANLKNYGMYIFDNFYARIAGRKMCGYDVNFSVIIQVSYCQGICGN